MRRALRRRHPLLAAAAGGGLRGRGGGGGRLVIYTSEGSLSCQVTDAGPGTHLWPLQEGHGLWIVHAAADKVTVSSGPDGSQVTAVFGWPAGPGSDRPGGQAT